MKLIFVERSRQCSRVVRQSSGYNAGSCGTKARRASFMAFYKTDGAKLKER